MTERYTRTAAALHWIIAALIAINIGLALSSKLLEGATRQGVLNLHKSFGITILGLVVIRLLWRWLHRPPALPASYPHHEKLAAHTAHAFLYILMISLPLSGWVRDSAWRLARANPMTLFETVSWPRFGFIMDLEPALKAQVHWYAGATHAWLAYILFALLFVHIAGVLKHHLVDRDPIIRRMLPK